MYHIRGDHDVEAAVGTLEPHDIGLFKADIAAAAVFLFCAFEHILKSVGCKFQNTGGPRQRGCAQGAKNPTVTPLWA